MTRSSPRAWAGRLRDRLSGGRKARGELAYWRERLAAEGDLGNSHYERFFTEQFGIPRELYRGKRLLDVGCGPRGSLEWAHDAAARVGLDPLARSYASLGTDRHAMSYVAAPAEAVPFPDASFDVISSLNSLDHVDDLEATIAEMGRVAADEARLLLLVEVGHDPTPLEPQALTWDVLARFAGDWEVSRVSRCERVTASLHYDAERCVPWNDEDPRRRPGALCALLTRRPRSEG